ncbi:MAG: nucleoside phosphorylase [Ktedonobacterales bacterium]
MTEPREGTHSSSPTGHDSATTASPSTKLADHTEGARLLESLGVAPGASLSDADLSALNAAAPADEEHITPRAFIDYVLQRQGRTLAEAQLPPLLFATFQSKGFAALVDTTQATLLEQSPHPTVTLALGSIAGAPLALAQLRTGAPAAVADLEELIALGARDIFVMGIAGSLQPMLPIGALLLPTRAIREEGTSFHYVPAGESVAPNEILLQALVNAAATLHTPIATGPVWTTDAPYRELASKIQAYSAVGVLAVEMEASALFAVAALRKVRLALALAISDELFHPWRPGFHMDELALAYPLLARIVANAATNVK